MADEIQAAKDGLSEIIRKNFGMVDLNGDNACSKEELYSTMLSDPDFDFPASIRGDTREAKMEAFFNALDADSDGKITVDEMIAGMCRFIDEEFGQMDQ